MRIYELTDSLPGDDPKKILVHTGEHTLITLARSNEIAYEMYKELLRRDYILYHFDQGVSKFYKRKNVNDLWVKKDLQQYNGIFYTLTGPKQRRLNKLEPKRLLVLFTCMPEKDEQNSAALRTRMFHQFFSEIHKSLVKNVYIMRIMDLNASVGSHYVKTINYPEMEIDIQLAIEKVVKELNINKDNIVLYGASKGGTGALLHGSVLGYKSLSVDPIVNLENYNKTDYHFLEGMREVDLSCQLNENLQKNQYKKYIICSPSVKFNYENIQKINQHASVRVIELQDEHIKRHSDVSKNSIPLQLMVINNLFYNLF